MVVRGAPGEADNIPTPRLGDTRLGIVKPKKYARGSIDLGHRIRISRSWQHVGPEALSEGDTVAGIGTVESIRETEELFVVLNILGEVHSIPKQIVIHAFTADAGD